ncbi:MAG: glutathionylspermidine synthase family protein, partial [Candidatus Sericytochromatia bacterium]|nr:glutathionylspermidine synthase family protein [Candidatus Sericytochromatia bacterium]
MQLQAFAPRPYALALAEQTGFTFHTIDGEPYWHEGRAYCFSLQQIEQDLEIPSNQLVEMCYELVEEALQRESWLDQLAIPAAYRPWIRQSWEADQETLYGRFDLSYAGEGPAKLLEFNADTPTSLYESAVFQWLWLEDLLAQGALPEGADQFNSIEDKLLAGIPELALPRQVHFAGISESDEDSGTLRYLAGLFQQAGHETVLMDMSEIGIDAAGDFTDLQEWVIAACFKLYPWEMMLREDFGSTLTLAETRWIETPWKMLLSNKGILPLLWEMFPGHPNLLPAYFADDPQALDKLGDSYVKKPLFSREGANISLFHRGEQVQHGGEYGAEGYILQAYHPLPVFEGWQGHPKVREPNLINRRACA